MLLLVRRAPSLQQHANIAQLLGHLLVGVEAFRSLQIVGCLHNRVHSLLRGLALRLLEHLDGHDDLDHPG